MSDPHQLVQGAYGYGIGRDDGTSYGDYIEQLMYLLFLKMADERTKTPHNSPSMMPAEAGWPTLMKRNGDDLFDHHRHVLEKLGNEKGLLGLIFNKSQNRFQDPAKLRRLIVESRRWMLALTRATWFRHSLFTG
jgi:type I restriction enzyme M protein